MNKQLEKEFKELTTMTHENAVAISKITGLTHGSVKQAFYVYRKHDPNANSIRKRKHKNKSKDTIRPVAKLVKTINATVNKTDIFINDLKISIPGRAITINGNKLEW